MIMLAVGTATQIGSDTQLGGWEEQSRAGSRAFAEMVRGSSLRQPRLA